MENEKKEVKFLMGKYKDLIKIFGENNKKGSQKK